jgi:membrane protease YdiL (CAAX protease family)
MSITVQPFMMAVSSLTSLLFENDTQAVIETISQSRPGLETVLVLALLPAVFEEITFRGVIAFNLTGLTPVKAAVLNGLYFGLAHLSLQQMPYTFFLGIVLYVLLRYSGSILAPVIMHLIINLSQTVMFSLLRDTNSQILNESNIYIGSISVFILVLFSIIFAITMVRFVKLSSVTETIEQQENTDRIITPSFITLIACYISIIWLLW